MLLREQVIDDDYVGAGNHTLAVVQLAQIATGYERVIVLIGKVTPTQQGNIHGPKIIGRNRTSLHQRSLSTRRLRPPIDHKGRLPTIIAEWQPGCCPYTLHA